MPAKLVSPVVKLGKQKIITGIIKDVLGDLCSVRLSGQGATLHSLRYIGPAPAVGDSVIVDYRSGKPVVHTGSENLENAIAEVQETILATTGTTNNTPPPAPEQPAFTNAVRRFFEDSAPTAESDTTLGYEESDLIISGGIAYLCLDATEDAAVWLPLTSSVKMFTFATEGVLATQTGAIRMYNKFGGTFTITKVFIAVNTAPTDASILVDIHKNGTTLFTTQSNRPSIVSSANTGESTTIENAVFNDGDYLTMDIDQIGSTIAGENLTVNVYFQ